MATLEEGNIPFNEKELAYARGDEPYKVVP